MKTPRRDDARRNRSLLIRAATASFADPQLRPAALHTDIARQTGLGRSTVYRHLGDRYDVAAAVIEDQLGAIRSTAREVAKGTTSVRDLLSLILTSQTRLHLLSTVVREQPEREQNRYVDAIIAAVGPALDRASSSGLLPAGFRPSDLRTVLVMVMAAATETRDPADLERMVGILLDGITPPS